MGTRLLLVAVRAFPAVRAFLAVCTLFCFLVLLRSRGFFLGLPRSRGFFSSGFSAVRSLSSSSGFYMFSLGKPVEEESDLSALLMELWETANARCTQLLCCTNCHSLCDKFGSRKMVANIDFYREISIISIAFSIEIDLCQQRG